jgi:uncharacterized surface protein with fasciclin (FAS1) repeats
MTPRRSLPRRSFLAAAAVAATAAPFLAACSGDDDPPAPAPTPVSVLDTAKGDARFSTLVAAIEAAGLTSALSGAGPYTVFAPTNDAFAALLTELGVTQQALLADTATLAAVLQYHVLGSRVASAAVQAGKPITPLAGGYFKATSGTGGLGFQDGRNRTGRITQTDINASNGVIHVLDKVMLPANQTVVGVAQSLPDFSILVEAVVAANLADTLSGAGPFTVFAPTNAAFAALLTELNVTKEALLANTTLLTSVLTYHVVSGLVLAADVPFATPIASVETGTFTVANTLVVTDERSRTANITATDVFASNGVIHVLDRVILPAASTT